MTYEIGQKVETPLGVGEIVGVIEYPKGYGNTYRVDIKIKEEVINKMYDFDELKPHKTAHEKLLSMGYECEDTYSGKQYTNTKEDEALPVRVDIDEISKYYYIPDNDCVNLELSRVLTQYLEEMEE